MEAMPMRILAALLAGAQAISSVPDGFVPSDSELPGPGWPGPDAQSSNFAWPSRQQPERLAAWPQEHDEDGKRTLKNCWKRTVLQDRKLGWPGLCLNLFNTGAKITTEDLCQKVCEWDARCSVWQFVNQTNPGQCWAGLGDDCIYRDGQGDKKISVQGAQRIMHGEVKVLKNLSGWKVNNLYNIGMEHEGNIDVSILRCKAWCYSSIYCEYWQYGPGGCWVDAPIWTTARGVNPNLQVQYPLTTNGGASNTSSEAAAMMWGEYIQHYCPPEEGVILEEPPSHDLGPILGGGVSKHTRSADAPQDMPMWSWFIIIAVVAGGIVACIYAASQQMAGGKREKKGRSTRGVKALKEDDRFEQSGFEMEASQVAGTESEYSEVMDGVPPPPPWRPPETGAAVPSHYVAYGASAGAYGASASAAPHGAYGASASAAPHGAYGASASAAPYGAYGASASAAPYGASGAYAARDHLGNSMASHQQANWWQGGQYPNQYAPTQRLDMMHQPYPTHDVSTRGPPPAVPFPAPPMYYGQYPMAHNTPRWYA